MTEHDERKAADIGLLKERTDLQQLEQAIRPVDSALYTVVWMSIGAGMATVYVSRRATQVAVESGADNALISKLLAMEGTMFFYGVALCCLGILSLGLRAIVSDGKSKLMAKSAEHNKNSDQH